MNVLYRVDRRLYSKGDIIEPQTDFEDSLKEEKLKMEKILDKKRPDGIPERNKCLFLCQDLQGALRFFQNMVAIFMVSFPTALYIIVVT